MYVYVLVYSFVSCVFICLLGAKVGKKRLLGKKTYEKLLKKAPLWADFVIFAAKNIIIRVMTTFALNNLWRYLQGLMLTQSEREWLVGKLSEPVNSEEKDKVVTETKKQRKVRPLSPEVEFLSNLHLKEFTQEELDEDPLLAAIVEDRRLRK